MELFSSAGNAQVFFAEKPHMKINGLNKQNHGYLIHTGSDKAFKGIVVNQTLQYLNGVSD